MFIYCFQDTGEDQKELNIFMRCFARIQKVATGIGDDGPVVVFSASVDALEGFLMEQARQIGRASCRERV